MCYFSACVMKGSMPKIIIKFFNLIFNLTFEPEISSSIPTIYELAVWKESGVQPYKCARALLVFSK